MIPDLRLAVLIDADNVPYSSVKGFLEEIKRNGSPTIKRIYSDWTRPNVAGWKKVLLENAITPIQQYSYTSGKNSSDSALIIDAMDILYSGKVDGFCIVSSDSDFTRLATRLREAGMKVIGIGEKKTPLPFITACDKFIYLEILNKKTDTKPATEPVKDKPSKSRVKKSEPVEVPEFNLTQFLVESVEHLADESGWTFLGELGNYIIKIKPDFDPRSFGFQKLLPLIKGTNRFEIDEREGGNRHSRHIFIKIKA